jgi:predicted ester cyclase
MTRDDIMALFARRRDAMVRRDAAALAADYAENAVIDSPWVGTVKGREANEQVWRAIFGAFPDQVIHEEELLVDGDRAALFATGSGTDLGGFMGLAPTGKPFRIAIVFLFTFDDRHIVHERRIYDFTGMLMQIGILKAKPA